MEIKRLRLMAGLTQIELSQASGIDRTKLSFAECGYIELSDEEEAAIRKCVAKAAKVKALAASRAAEHLSELVNIGAPVTTPNP